MNNVGIRKAARFMGCSPSMPVRWVRELAVNLRRQLQNAEEALRSKIPDTIEMDEIYIRIKKRGTDCRYGLLVLGWRGKVIAYVIGHAKECAVELYNKARPAVGTIRRIYTDGNSCYEETLKKIGISHLHSIERGKSQTHLIESTNSIA
jgi:transposase-like protein